MAKVGYDAEERKIFSMSEIGKAYLEYNDKVGGVPFGFTVGMPDFDIEERFGDVAGLYKECIKQGKTWEELLNTTGRWDELPEE